MRKRKGLFGKIFSNADLIVKTVNKTVSSIEKTIEFKEKVEEKIEKVKGVYSAVKKTVDDVRKNDDKIIAIKSKVKVFSKKVDWVKTTLENKVDEKKASVLSQYPLLLEFAYNSNLVSDKMDSKIRKSKIFLIKGLAKTGVITKVLDETLSLYRKGLLKEGDFTRIVLNLSFFEMMYKDVHLSLNRILEIKSNPPVKLHHNWYYYVLGRFYFYSLLKWQDYNNDVSVFVREHGNTFKFDNIEDELDEYVANKDKWGYLTFPDLVWGTKLSLHRASASTVSHELKIIKVFDELNKKNNDYASIYSHFFQFLLYETKDASSILVFLDSILKVNGLFKHPFNQYSGKFIEKKLKSEDFDNSEYVYYVLMFSVLSDKKFYFNLHKVIDYMQRIGIGNVGFFVKMMREASVNFNNVYEYLLDDAPKEAS